MTKFTVNSDFKDAVFAVFPDASICKVYDTWPGGPCALGYGYNMTLPSAVTFIINMNVSKSFLRKTFGSKAMVRGVTTLK